MEDSRIVGETLWLCVAEGGSGYMPFGSLLPTINGWTPPEDIKDDYIPYPHSEETPEGPLRDLFGPRFPDLRAHVISDGEASNVPRTDSSDR